MTLLTDYPLASRTSFHTGGSADMLVIPETEEELVSAVEQYGDSYVFGNLSNTLITDKGIRGNVIITTGVKAMTVKETEITASCGVALSAFAGFAMANGLSGAEFCYGIPGTIGGAVFMNAGAYGGQISDIFKSAVLYSKENGVHTLSKDEMCFAYRKSAIQSSKAVVLSVTFSLSAGNKDDIKSKMEGFMTARKSKQPLEFPSCGSVFKRPEGHFAGALIEQCNLKGVSVGGAEVSEKHAGFIINKGNATSNDFIMLTERIKQTVYESTGVMLEEEVVTVGEK